MDSNSIFENKKDDDFLLFGEDDREIESSINNKKIDNEANTIENITDSNLNSNEETTNIDKVEEVVNDDLKINNKEGGIFYNDDGLEINISDIENSILGDNSIKSNGLEKNILEEVLLNNDKSKSNLIESDITENINDKILNDEQNKEKAEAFFDTTHNKIDLNDNIEEPILNDAFDKTDDKFIKSSKQEEDKNINDINSLDNDLANLNKNLDEQELNIENIANENKSNEILELNEEGNKKEIEDINKNIIENIENLNLDNLNSKPQEEDIQLKNIAKEETNLNKSEEQHNVQEQPILEAPIEEKNVENITKSEIVQEEQKQETKIETLDDIMAFSTNVENNNQNSERKKDNEDKELHNTSENTPDKHESELEEDSNFKLSDDVLNDLEAVNDDFAAELRAEKEKELEEARKNSGQDETEKEEELNLKPIEAEEKLSDIINLNLGNIEEFLKNNGKSYCDLKEKKENLNELTNKNDSQEEKTQNPEESAKEISDKDRNIPTDSILNNFKLNSDLWDELKLSDELQDKVTKRVRIEIKSFIKDNLIPLLEKITK